MIKSKWWKGSEEIVKMSSVNELRIRVNNDGRKTTINNPNAMEINKSRRNGSGTMWTVNATGLFVNCSKHFENERFRRGLWHQLFYAKNVGARLVRRGFRARMAQVVVHQAKRKLLVIMSRKNIRYEPVFERVVVVVLFRVIEFFRHLVVPDVNIRLYCI